MSSALGRLTAYALILLGVFATAFGVGNRFSSDEAVPHSHGDSSAPHSDHGGAIAGLGATVDGVSLELLTTPVETPGRLELRFVDAKQQVITDFADNHGALVHLLVVRSDLSSFQHVHPEMTSDGTWSVALDIDEPGSYRVVADVAPTSLGGAISPSLDIVVPGIGRRSPIPPAADDVTTAGGLRISRNGFEFVVSPAADLEPYLGQPAHLVGFREGDLSYIHLHADSGSDGVFTFAAPPEGTEGLWRFFLQFGYSGEVITQAFTVQT